jgi:hypothetical protein
VIQTITKPWRFLLLLSLLLTACTSPSPPARDGPGRAAGPVVAISSPIVDATTNKAIVAPSYEA